MAEQKREFTGVWIPRFIIEDESLNWTQRGLYAEIASFDVCRKSNIKLAERMGMTTRQVQTNLKVLIDKGYVMRVSFDGRQRQISAVRDEKMLQGRGEENFVSGVTKTSPIDNSIDNNPTGYAEQAPPSPAEKREPTILKLYYDVLKAHDILVTNNNHVRGWSKKLEEQTGYENAARYLNFLLVIDFAAIEKAEWNTGADKAFVPTLTTAYDVISKRSKFRNCLNKAIELTGGLDSLPRRKNETTT